MSVIPYIQRDISWLAFNYRVLQEAKDPSVPLLEKIKFLAIYSSNLDEFFRVRVANHRNLVRAGKKTQRDLSFSPEEVLKQVLNIVNEQQYEFSEIFEKHITPALIKEGIVIRKLKKLNQEQLEFIYKFYEDSVQPFVQPVILNGNKVKPFLNNARIYLALHLQDKETPKGDPTYALLLIPSQEVSRFIELPSRSKNQHEIIFLDEIIRYAAQFIFPGYDIMGSYSIKLTRDAELYIDDEFSGNLMAKVKKSLAKRKVGPASRLVYDRKMPKHFLAYLMKVFNISSYDLSPEGRQHNNSDFFTFPSFGKKNLKDKDLPPLPFKPLEKTKSVFDKIKQKDQFLFYPYHSYESTIRFFEDAAIDPQVTHIKIIQYRVAKKSRIMEALMLAVKNGKQVSAFIEIKARFDEEANLQWGEKLEEAGVKVNYSMPGLKVHSKLAIVRKIVEGVPEIYVYLSTGNFHEKTANLYTDFGLFTYNTKLTAESMRLFTYLETKIKPSKPFQHLGVGQFNLNVMLNDLIKNEIKNAEAGKKASIILKLNSLQDREIIKLLYKASQKGVRIKLIVRGICSLVPGVKGISDNITCISIIDRFLEHARVYIFRNDGKEKIFMSSADWMTRNLYHRIETIVPIYDTDHKSFIKRIIKIQLRDNQKSRIIDAKKTNKYSHENPDLMVRSQIETYYICKREGEK